MRLVSYVHDGQVRAGVRVDDRVERIISGEVVWL